MIDEKQIEREGRKGTITSSRRGLRQWRWAMGNERGKWRGRVLAKLAMGNGYRVMTTGN